MWSAGPGWDAWTDCRPTDTGHRGMPRRGRRRVPVTGTVAGLQAPGGRVPIISKEVAMPYGSDTPTEGAVATQARGARIWLTEALQPVLHELPDRELDRLAAELLTTAHRLSDHGNQAAAARWSRHRQPNHHRAGVGGNTMTAQAACLTQPATTMAGEHMFKAVG